MRTRRIASFDVGMRNLAYAVVQVAENDGNGATQDVGLVRWGLIDLEEYNSQNKTNSANSAVPAVIRALDAVGFADMDVDVVLIENQPCMKNPRMKTVQVAIQAFFESHKHYRGTTEQTIRLVNPSNKVGHGGTYADRKRKAVAHCKEYLERTLVDGGVGVMGRSDALAILAGAKKKDDLADAFLQALWYLVSVSSSSSS